MVTPKLERRHLEALVALAQHSAFSKAAEQLLIAPSALAAAIRQVERMVGEPIVRRTPAGMSLTTRGLEIARTAGDALRGIEAVLEGPSGASELHAGVLVVHTSPTLAESLGATLVNAMRTRYPGLPVVVHAPKRAVLADIEYAVGSGEADFGMTEPLGRPVPGLRYWPLGQQEIAYVFPSTASERPRTTTLDHVREYGLLVVPEFDSSAVYRTFRSRATDVDNWLVARVAHRHSFIDLAAGGVAGFMCDYGARAEAESLGLHVAPFREPVVRRFSTITRANDARSITRAAIDETQRVRRSQHSAPASSG